MIYKNEYAAKEAALKHAGDIAVCGGCCSIWAKGNIFYVKLKHEDKPALFEWRESIPKNKLFWVTNDIKTTRPRIRRSSGSAASEGAIRCYSESDDCPTWSVCKEWDYYQEVTAPDWNPDGWKK